MPGTEAELMKNVPPSPMELPLTIRDAPSLAAKDITREAKKRLELSRVVGPVVGRVAPGADRSNSAAALSDRVGCPCPSAERIAADDDPEPPAELASRSNSVS